MILFGVVYFFFSISLIRFGKCAFSVTFDCAKVTKAHRGRFKPPPGPPGEGVTFSPPSPVMRHLRSPAAPGSHEEPVLLPVCFSIGPGTSLKLCCAFSLARAFWQSPQNGTAPMPPLCKGRWVRRTRRDCGFLVSPFQRHFLTDPSRRGTAIIHHSLFIIHFVSFCTITSYLYFPGVIHHGQPSGGIAWMITNLLFSSEIPILKNYCFSNYCNILGRVSSLR